MYGIDLCACVSVSVYVSVVALGQDAAHSLAFQTWVVEGVQRCKAIYIYIFAGGCRCISWIYFLYGWGQLWLVFNWEVTVMHSKMHESIHVYIYIYICI